MSPVGKGETGEGERRKRVGEHREREGRGKERAKGKCRERERADGASERAGEREGERDGPSDLEREEFALHTRWMDDGRWTTRTTRATVFERAANANAIIALDALPRKRSLFGFPFFMGFAQRKEIAP